MERQRPIIAVLTDRYYQYQAELVEHIASELNTAGFGILCITAKELQAAGSSTHEHAVCNTIYQQIESYGIQGLITLSGTLGHGVDSDTVIRFMSKYQVPKVSLGINLPGITSVYFEETEGMSNLMDHLLNSGSRSSFAFVRGHLNDPFSIGREKIFYEALTSAGHTSNNIFYLEGDYNPFTTYQAVTDLLCKHQQIDCIVAANDVMAASAARAAKAHGLTIPKDIAISGFDDSSDATRHSPALTTVRQPARKMARDSVALLLQQIERLKICTNTPSSVNTLSTVNSTTINSELIVRGSTNPTDSELKLNDSFNEESLKQLLIDSMHGLETPEQLTMQQISAPLWNTIQNGSIDIIAIAAELSDTIIFQHAHWWLNLSDQIEAISEQLIERRYKVAHIALVSSAIARVKERIWALEMDRKFESSRLQNVRADMQLEMSSCNNLADILSAMDGWLAQIKPSRCFLVCYKDVDDKPAAQAQLIHVSKDGISESPATHFFDSNLVLPADMTSELTHGLLVFSPVYSNNMLFGYLLIDPRDMHLAYIDAAAQSIGNAMRTHHHIKALHFQKDSLLSVNAELEQLANFDALTGLSNRLQFQHYLHSCTEEWTGDVCPLALLFIDLDGFKLVNDTLGHSMGDELLKLVAQRLLDCVSASAEYDGFISRLGGDEFTVILHPKNDTCSIATISQQLLSQLASPYLLYENEVSISASIGYALYPDNSSDTETLVKYADIAMYHAKNNGKNNIALFSPYMINVDTQELKMAQELRHALANDVLCMFYQPRIDLRTGKIRAVEALMRWLIPSQDGLVVRSYPDVFIALAEKIGVISQLDTYALHYCCKQAAQWAKDGTPLQISVNVSVNQLQQENFVETIMNAVAIHQLDPALLEIEITESAAMTDVEENIIKLSKIKEAGIEISIDDFGTGYSSLNYLKRLPVHNLKIDRSFIIDINECDGGDSADAAIVRSVVALGKNMGFRLIAEGIETEAQHEFINSLDCDQVQGYLYSKPLPADEVTHWLENDSHQDHAEHSYLESQIKKNKAA